MPILTRNRRLICRPYTGIAVVHYFAHTGSPSRALTDTELRAVFESMFGAYAERHNPFAVGSTSQLYIQTPAMRGSAEGMHLMRLIPDTAVGSE